MKISLKLLLSLLLIGSSLAGFSQKKPKREYVSDIPAGRSILIQPLFGNEQYPKGKVTIDFTLDRKGNVISAVADRKTATLKKDVIAKCEAAVKGAKFNEVKNGPETQHGSLTYTF